MQVGGLREWVSMELIKIDNAPKRQTALEFKQRPPRIAVNRAEL